MKKAKLIRSINSIKTREKVTNIIRSLKLTRTHPTISITMV